ncbi:hypothetical protein ABMA27_000877 [Loxostege sticticalis]|uniref:Inositol polyphosphate 1-phosphatase n=1 Tax=Loxostege sticticalis TaxID=481309 RepID=A0ABR3I0Q1_LOXSC
MTEILQALIDASERAALVAKSCCSDDCQDDLLIAEKCEGEANARFEKDYKTIADVLAQECAKTTLISRFPELSGHVRGEECCEIGGKAIKLESSVDETAKLLSSLVQPNLAKRMAVAAHSDVKHQLCNRLPTDLPDVDVSDLGIWIDPIDATAEFIAGVNGTAASDGGLECVTVLIGAYKRSTGEPVIGVINQPFYDGGKGRLFWGICYGDIKKWGEHNVEIPGSSGVILMSAAEDPQLKKAYEDKFEIKSAAGAGNKLLKVAIGEAEAYILSKGTTFLWDTCGPHAIIKARGGDILSFNTDQPIKYNIPHSDDTQQFCNSGGILACSHDNDQNEFKYILNVKNVAKNQLFQ